MVLSPNHTQCWRISFRATVATPIGGFIQTHWANTLEAEQTDMLKDTVALKSLGNKGSYPVMQPRLSLAAWPDWMPSQLAPCVCVRFVPELLGLFPLHISFASFMLFFAFHPLSLFRRTLKVRFCWGFFKSHCAAVCTAAVVYGAFCCFRASLDWFKTHPFFSVCILTSDREQNPKCGCKSI